MEIEGEIHATLFASVSVVRPEVFIGQQGQQLGRKAGCEVEESKGNWNLWEQMRTYEFWNSWGQSETCDFLSPSPSSLMQWLTGEAEALCQRAECTPGPGLRVAERDSGRVGELQALVLSCTNKVSQISVKRYVLPPSWYSALSLTWFQLSKSRIKFSRGLF